MATLRSIELAATGHSGGNGRRAGVTYEIGNWETALFESGSLRSQTLRNLFMRLMNLTVDCKDSLMNRIMKFIL